MSQELLYTSAPQGLKPGSRGFCTVVSTQGMPSTLAECLESLSGYRHAFPIHGPEAHLNPVNYAHLIVTVGGRRYHVLSRVANAGQDYTGRTNKLAHHVALDASELTPGGPAWVLADENFCLRKWDGQVRLLAQGRSPRKDRPPQGPCRAWEKQTGDAGWAGVLAQWTQEGHSPIYLIFPPGTDTLSLVVEALNLLPETKRWNVTFSTYFTKLPPGISCQWRFVLEGTPEATQARRDPRHKLLDLTRPLGRAPDGPLVEAARTGKLPQPVQSTPRRTAVSPGRPAPREIPPPASGRPRPVPEDRHIGGEDVEVVPHAQGIYPIAAEVQRPPQLPASRPPRSRPAPGSFMATAARSSSWAMTIVVGGLMFLLGIGGTVMALRWLEPKPQTLPRNAVAESPPPKTSKTSKQPSSPKYPPRNKAQKPKKQTKKNRNKNKQKDDEKARSPAGQNKKQEPDPDSPASEDTAQNGDSPPGFGSSSGGQSDTGATPTPEKPAAEKPAPLAQLIAAKNEFHSRFGDWYYLPLKLPKQDKRDSPFQPVTVWTPNGYKPVRFSRPDSIQLQLTDLLSSVRKADVPSFVLTPKPDSPRLWQIERGQEPPRAKVGKFKLTDKGDLLFRRDSHWPSHGLDLRLCLLTITQKAGQDTVVCTLLTPVAIKPFSLDSDPQKVSLNQAIYSVLGGSQGSRQNALFSIRIKMSLSDELRKSGAALGFAKHEKPPKLVTKEKEISLPVYQKNIPPQNFDLPTNNVCLFCVLQNTARKGEETQQGQDASAEQTDEPQRHKRHIQHNEQLITVGPKNAVAVAKLQASVDIPTGANSRRRRGSQKHAVVFNLSWGKRYYYNYSLNGVLEDEIDFGSVRLLPFQGTFDSLEQIQEKLEQLIDEKKNTQSKGSKKREIQKRIQELKTYHKISKRREAACRAFYAKENALDIQVFWEPSVLDPKSQERLLLLLYTKQNQK